MPLTRLATLLVRDAVTAEDVVQDAFVAMRSAWPRLGDTEKALAYLRQAVVNRSRSVLRHRSVTGTNLHQAGAEHGALDLLDQPAAVTNLAGGSALEWGRVLAGSRYVVSEVAVAGLVAGIG